MNKPDKKEETTKTNKKEKTKSKFKKFLSIYVIVLIILMLAFLAYVADSLTKYEKNQIENYMNDVVATLGKSSKKIGKYIDTSNLKISEFEKKNASINEGLKYIANNQKITYKLSKESTQEEKPIYDIYADDENILQITLDGTNKKTRLGLLTFNEWEIDKVEVKREEGLYVCNIIVPNNYTVYVNDKKLSSEQIESSNQDEGLAEISKYTQIPYTVKYKITNLLKKPDIKIVDDTIEGNTATKSLDYVKVESEQELKEKIKGEVDILKIAKDWSLYLTDDLTGRLHGYYSIKQYLIEDSQIDKFAYKWATGEDITFISNHSLFNPAFEDEKLSDFEIYNENAFSCKVYLKKNMRIGLGKKVEDIMHEKMYFVYYDDTEDGQDNPTWKLVNMQSVTDNNKQ